MGKGINSGEAGRKYYEHKQDADSVIKTHRKEREERKARRLSFKKQRTETNSYELGGAMPAHGVVICERRG